MRLQIDNLSMKLQVLRIKLQTARVSPARQPLKEFQTGKPQSIALVHSLGIGFGQPANESPILRGKEFLFVRRTRCQLEQLRKRPDLFTCARAEQTEADGQIVKRRMIAGGLRVADRAKRSARRIQMLRCGRKHPVLYLIENLLLLLGVLDLGKPRDVGVRLQLRGQRSIGAQKENGNF